MQIHIDGEKADTDAVFDIEILADEIDVSPTTIRVATRSGVHSEKQKVLVRVPENADVAITCLRLYVTQAGRYVGVLNVPSRA